MSDQVKEIALLNASGAQSPADFAFAAEACRRQLVEHFLPAWAGYLPDEMPMTVVGYSSTRDLKPGSFWGIEVLPSLDSPGVLGDHGGLRAVGKAWGRSLPNSEPESHEVLEMALDHYADRWIRLPDGTVTALECADAVERDTYPIAVTIGGVTRDVMVSNFVYPAWFGEASGTRFDHMGLCKVPGENRGYLIVQMDDGQTVNVFAERSSGAYRAKVIEKLRYGTRTAARHDYRQPRAVLPSLAALRRAA